MKHRFINHVMSICDTNLACACKEILDTSEFLTWPASLSFHHAYEGGLLAHTLEVTDYALASALPGTNYDILLAACLLHDVAKVREYALTELGKMFVGHGRGTSDVSSEKYTVGEGILTKDMWYYTDYTKRIHHIAGSAIEFTCAARKHGVSEDIIEQVQHCILAHHGRREWGSPVEPQTIEALLLSQADMVSAKFGATKESLL